MSDPHDSGKFRDRIGRAARLGGLAARTSAGWFTSAILEGVGGKRAAARLQRIVAAGTAERLGEMKGLAMKLGQVLSFMIDDVPEELRQALAVLQTRSRPRPFAEIEAVIERSLGRACSGAFRCIDPAPVAAASIGQVHRAELPDGTAVAVKVQYPDIAAAVRADLANLPLIARFVRLLLPGVDAEEAAQEVRERILQELDYAAEARQQSAFAKRFAGHPFIAVPRVIASHSSGEVLTSEYVEGRSYQAVLSDQAEARARYGEILFRFLMRCLFDAGSFIADPHPGNYVFRDGAGVAFLDYGCVKELLPPRLDLWRRFVRARLEGDVAVSLALAVPLGFVDGAMQRDAAQVLDALDRLYVPFRGSGPRPYRGLLQGASVTVLFGSELSTVRKALHVPRDLVFVNRTMGGMSMVLARLGAIVDWDAVAREILRGGPPATALGEAERAWWLRRPGTGGAR